MTRRLTRALAVLLLALATVLTTVLTTALTGLAPAAAAPTPTSPTTPTDPPTTPPDTPTTPGDSAATGVRVLLEAVGPTVLEPGGTLNVRAVVHNDQVTPLTGEVRLWVRQTRSSTRTALQRWVDGDTGPGAVAVTVPLTEPLPPESSRRVDLTVPADELGLPSRREAWGPRGIAVEVLDGARESAAVTRSFVIWQGAPGGYLPTRVSVLVPITDGAPDVATGHLPADRLADLTGSGGRLQTVLEAASLPGVTWALDPALLEQASAGADAAGGTEGADGPDDAPGTSPSTPPDDDTSGEGAASGSEQAGSADELAQWHQDLEAAAAGHEVVSLPYGDPDVNALAHAGQDSTYELAEQQGRDTVQSLLGRPARTDVAWPVSGSLDDDTVRMLLAAGRSSVVLSGGSHPPAARLGITVTGRSTIEAGTRTASGLLVDTPLSENLARLGGPVAPAPPEPTGTAAPDGTDGDPSQPSQEDPGPAGVVQRLLAETAAITLERPFDPRHVLVAAPRGWDPDPQAAVSAVQALTTAPWTEARPLGDLIDTRPPDIERDPLQYPDSDQAAELPASGLRAAAEALDQARTTATVLSDPEATVSAAERSVVAAASSSWRDRLPEWEQQVGELVRQVAADADALRVLQGSPLTVVSSQVQLPITVQNGLDGDAEVQVLLRPTSPRLVVPAAPVVQVAANSQERLAVPVRAVANGNTDVVVQLLTPTGEPIGDAVTMRVRVRADWETWGTLVVGVVVVLVLVVGLVRGIRQGRRQRELAAPDAGAVAPQPPDRTREPQA